MSAPVGRHRRHLPGLDGLRAIGALGVLTTHVGFHSGRSVNGPFAGVLARLDSGVALFFVISGFLLVRPYVLARFGVAPRPALGRYLRHRVLRIVPALWLTVLLAWLLVPHGSHASLGDYVAHAFFVQIYQSDTSTPGLSQLWSLSTEWAFYLALPLLAALLLRGDGQRLSTVWRQLAVLLLVPVASAVWMALPMMAVHPERALWLPGYLGWFSIGAALAVWHCARAAGVLGRSWLDGLAAHPWTTWALAAGLYLVLTSAVAGPYGLTASTQGEAFVKNLSYGVLAALVVLPAVGAFDAADDPPAVRALGRGAWRFLGDISYGVFCYHLIALSLVEQALDYDLFQGRFWALWVPTVAITLVAATVSHRWFERPIMRWGRRWDRGPGQGSGRRPARAERSADPPGAQQAAATGV